MRRKRKKKQQKLIIISSICFLFVMTVGYAAFNTNLSITVKGNIKKSNAASQLIEKVVTSGDGLYLDTYESNENQKKYIYKGANPNNYIKFNNELWRIMALESDGTLKIMRNESIGNMSWDTPDTRNSSTSTYCTPPRHCNAWAATSNLVNNPNVFILYSPNGNPNTDTIKSSGTVIQDSSLNTYLNTTYLETIKDDAKYIEKYNFNVGSPGQMSDTEDIATDINQEALYKWNGKVGLMNITELLRTTTDNECTSLRKAANSFTKSVCSNNNWMWYKNSSEWTISPDGQDAGSVWIVLNAGYAGPTGADYSSGVRPSLYLNKDITLSGSGTEIDPYTIIK